MIKYNNSNINDWYYNSGITKVYYNGDVCYQKIEGGDTPTPPTPVIPSGYTQVEYLEAPNVNEYPYIDTNFAPNENTRVIADFQYTDTNTHPRCFGCGYWSALGYIWNAENGIGGGEWKFKYGYTNGWYATGIQTDFDRHTVDMDKNLVYFDNVLVYTATPTTFQMTDNIALFGQMYNGQLAPGVGEYMTGKFYSFKIYDDGTLVRDFVPCMRDSDSKYGMYDIVNGVFYTSPNEYAFTGGNPV